MLRHSTQPHSEEIQERNVVLMVIGNEALKVLPQGYSWRSCLFRLPRPGLGSGNPLRFPALFRPLKPVQIGGNAWMSER